MNRIFIIFLVLMFSCSKKKISKKYINLKLENKKEIVDSLIRNEVYVSLNGFSKSLSINVINEKNQMKPDLITLSHKVNSNEIIIPTDSVVDIVISNRFYIAKAHFKKGDSIFITNKLLKKGKRNIEYPFFNLKKSNLFELNFDYYILTKSPSRNSYSIHRMNSRIDKKLYRFSLDEVVLNTKRIADSLLNNGLISNKFYEKEIFELNYFEKSYLLEEAIKKQKKVEYPYIKVTETNGVVSGSTYITYLINRIKYDHFFKEGFFVKNLKIIEFLIKNRPFKYDSRLEYLVNDNLIYSIYNRERENLDVVLESLEKTKQFSLKQKYRDILSKEKEELSLKRKLKSLNGELLQFHKNNEVIRSFDEIIKSHRGKLILIDFWASWCAPCRKEIPSLRQIKKEIDTTKLSIISISIDKKISAWKKAVKQEKLQRNSFLLLNHNQSEIVKKYQISTIPRYLLFDENGVLINDNTPIPSDKRLKEIIFENIKSL